VNSERHKKIIPLLAFVVKDHQTLLLSTVAKCHYPRTSKWTGLYVGWSKTWQMIKISDQSF
jgi:hypothetical protein